ncbi:MAG: hypothetical protein K2Y27_20945 [Xanthobacteraceae bacterium]|nr:hypothetical protein [Xanthobacteraceae bacterium]
MGRVLALAIAFYVYGDASFDGRRPAALDRPLREFRRSVDAMPSDGRRVLFAIDRLRGHHALDHVLRALNRYSL